MEESERSFMRWREGWLRGLRGGLGGGGSFAGMGKSRKFLSVAKLTMRGGRMSMKWAGFAKSSALIPPSPEGVHFGGGGLTFADGRNSFVTYPS